LGQLCPALPSYAAVQPRQVRVVPSGTFDLVFQEGRLAGRVVDHTGAAVADAEVAIRQGHKDVARVRTDERGTFAVAGLPAGLYEVGSGKTVGQYRLWTEQTAPPAANEQALLVLGQNGARGQNAALRGGQIAVATLVVATLITSIIAIDRINDLDDEVSKIPKSE
jgi:hypothetical protein